MSYEEEFDDRVIESLTIPHGNFEKLIPAHCAYQRKMCRHYFNPISDRFLNIGCKEDPANLGDWKGCINIDAQEYDMHEKKNLHELPNFVHEDYFDYDPPRPVHGIVLGEVLEHCTDEVAWDLVAKMEGEIDYGGVMIITVPHDPRTKETQLEMQGNKEEQFYEVRKGVTSWHSNVWTKEKLKNLFDAFKLEMIHYETATWIEDRDMFWHFFVARRVGEIRKSKK